MRKTLVLVLAAPFALIGAAAPSADQPRGETAVRTSAAPAPAATYPSCRPGPGDDRCIQLYERGVRNSYARWQDRRGAEPVRVARNDVRSERKARPDDRRSRARHAQIRRAGERG